MSEVEKLYSLAGVDKVCTHTIINPERCNHRRMTRCCGCDWLELPPFTAEKQIELIKKLGNINIDIDNGCYMSSEILEVEAHCDDFEETLAEFVINLWQDLTEAEQNEIKNILKG